MRISDWSSDVCSSDLNHTAKLNMMAMKEGDEAFFYHSNIGKECVGIMEIAEESFPDPTADKGSPRVVVRVAPVRALAHPVDRKSVVPGKSVSVGGVRGGGRFNKKKRKANKSEK